MAFDNQKIPVLTGPTGVGKTDLALDWVSRYPHFEIISVDSAMVYRGMDIGTAKPEPAILKGAPHHLINIKDPSESYSVAEFYEDCRRAIHDIFARGKVPLLVGGTMMYLNVLRQGLANIPPVNPDVRVQLSEDLKIKGVHFLYEKLQKADSVSAARLKNTDTQRILRALEVVESTGRPLHHYWENNQKKVQNPLVFLGIPVEDRSDLHKRIERRTQQMLKIGLVEEVRELYERGDLHGNLPAIRSVGYRQVWEYFLGNSKFENLQEKVTIATRQLAKRQLTWIRSWDDIQWITKDFKLIELFS